MRSTFGIQHQQQILAPAVIGQVLQSSPPWTVTPSAGQSRPAPLTPCFWIWSAKSCQHSSIRSELGHWYLFNTVPPAVQGLQMAFTTPEITVLAEKGISRQLSLNTRSSLWTYYHWLWASTQCRLVLWFQGIWVGKQIVSSSANRHVSSPRAPVSVIAKTAYNLLAESLRLA